MIWYIIAGIISLFFLLGTTCEYIKTIKGKIKAAKENRHYYMGDDDWTFCQWFLESFGKTGSLPIAVGKNRI